MAEINGVQWARLWARAWKDPKDGFKDLLENDPRAAASQFSAECAKKKHIPFPKPSSHTPLLDLDEMDKYGVSLQKMSKSELNAIIQNPPVRRKRSKWLSPREVKKELTRGVLKIESQD